MQLAQPWPVEPSNVAAGTARLAMNEAAGPGQACVRADAGVWSGRGKCVGVDADDGPMAAYISQDDDVGVACSCETRAWARRAALASSPGGWLQAAATANCSGIIAWSSQQL